MTDWDVEDTSETARPIGEAGVIQIRHRATGEPPASEMHPCAVVRSTAEVVVVVKGAEFHVITGE